MNKIDKHKCIITVIFFLMSFLNFFNLLNIQSYGVFGLSIGALFICISTCFEGELTMIGINVWSVIKNIFYFAGWIFIVISIYLKQNIFFDTLIKAFDSNTLMLLSLGFTFLSLIVSDWSQKKQQEKIVQESKELDKLIEEQDRRQLYITELIEKYKKRRKED